MTADGDERRFHSDDCTCASCMGQLGPEPPNWLRAPVADPSPAQPIQVADAVPTERRKRGRPMRGAPVVQPDGGTVGANGARQVARQVADWRALYRPIADIIAETDEEIAWLVPGLIPRGWTGMVVADTKVGKTLLMLQLARAVGLGEEFLGRSAQQGTVLLALVDDPKVLTKKRLKDMLTDVPGVRAYIDRWNRDALVALEEAVRDEPPDLVVVDALVKVLPGTQGAENDPAGMDKVMERFSALTINQKTTVIVIHHENAAGGPRGTTAIPCAAPFVWALKTDAKEGECVRDITLSIAWKLEPVEPLMLRHDEGGFTALGTASGLRHADLENRVLKAVGEGNDRQTTIRDHLRSKNDETLQALTALVAKGLLVRSGTGRKGDPFTYALGSAIA